MLWLAATIKKVDHRTFTLAKGRCAETVVHLMKDERSVRAVKAAIDYGNDRITYKELDNAAYAAYAVANTADDADDAAANAADASYSILAAYSAAANATDAAYAAADYTDDVRVRNQKATADICRKILTDEISKYF